jgi:DNA-binding response OmpR family regulator
VYALSRRARPADPPKLERSGLLLDWAHRQAFRDGRYVPLARKEFGVLAELLRAGGAVVRTEHLLEKVWDEHTDPFTNTVRVTVMKLRRKLGDPPVVETVPGVGYQIR